MATITNFLSSKNKNNLLGTGKKERTGQDQHSFDWLLVQGLNARVNLAFGAGVAGAARARRRGDRIDASMSASGP